MPWLETWGLSCFMWSPSSHCWYPGLPCPGTQRALQQCWGRAGSWACTCQAQQVAVGRWSVGLGMPLGEGGHSSKHGGSACATGVAQQRQGWAAQLFRERVGCPLPASMKAGSCTGSGVGSRLTAFLFFLVAKPFFSCSPHFQSLYCYLIHIARILC